MSPVAVLAKCSYFRSLNFLQRFHTAGMMLWTDRPSEKLDINENALEKHINTILRMLYALLACINPFLVLVKDI